MNHKNKIKLARKMRTEKERKNGVSIFQTEAWENRKKFIQQRVDAAKIKVKQASQEI